MTADTEASNDLCSLAVRLALDSESLIEPSIKDEGIPTRSSGTNLKDDDLELLVLGPSDPILDQVAERKQEKAAKTKERQD
jgi:hypothetical protein